MSGHNHVALRGLELALIEGTPIIAMCGISFVPTLRVGSGGKADEPAWPKCEACHEIKDLLFAERDAREEAKRLNREIRAIQKKVAGLRGGQPIKLIGSPRPKRVEVTA